MKTYEIYFWHGFCSDLAIKIAPFCEAGYLANGSMGYTYTGTLDHFAEQYKNKFMVFPEFIAITQHSSFGQR